MDRSTPDRAADELALLRQHAEVLFDVDSEGRLLAVNEPEPDPPPRLFVARGFEHTQAWCRGDVGDATTERCRELIDAMPPWDGGEPAESLYEPLRAALATGPAVADASGGPAYTFTDARPSATGVETVLIDEATAGLLDRHFPYTRSVLDTRSPVVVVVRAGAAVAACYCARKRPTAAEAGVATEEAFRGQGFATAVVIAWREAVEREGLMPLYSTSWDNTASRRVAERLGLRAYADTFEIS